MMVVPLAHMGRLFTQSFRYHCGSEPDHFSGQTLFRYYLQCTLNKDRTAVIPYAGLAHFYFMDSMTAATSLVGITL